VNAMTKQKGQREKLRQKDEDEVIEREYRQELKERAHNKEYWADIEQGVKQVIRAFEEDPSKTKIKAREKIREMEAQIASKHHKPLKEVSKDSLKIFEEEL
jgi:hypothetical protein